jgi:hypothetical protein
MNEVLEADFEQGVPKGNWVHFTGIFLYVN